MKYENVNEARRKNMQHIRSKDTSIEVALRKALWNHGYRYRKNYDKLPGKPDICLTKYKIAIFCDSEFFHGKEWEVKKDKVAQGNNGEYWFNKIQRNIERDSEVDKELNNLGWKVIHFWGRDILKDPDSCIEVIEGAILDKIVEDSESLETLDL